MSGLKEKLKVASEKIDEQRKAQLAENKKLFMEAVNELFDKHEELMGIRWRQYTPYFNDGSPCTFGVGELFITTRPVSELEDLDEDDDEVDMGDYGDGFVSPYYLKENKVLYEDLCSLEGFMVNIEDCLEGMFDDHVIVTIERGKDPYTEEYYHD